MNLSFHSNLTKFFEIYSTFDLKKLNIQFLSNSIISPAQMRGDNVRSYSGVGARAGVTSVLR